MTARAYTPTALAQLLAKLHAQGVPVTRAKLAPDGSLDIEISGQAESRDPFDLVEMKR